MDIDFKYQNRFACDVPAGYTTIKSFFEVIPSDCELVDDQIISVITQSFEQAGVQVDTLELSKDLATCFVKLKGEDVKLKITIRTRPSLVVDGKIFKLEEFDF